MCNPCIKRIKKEKMPPPVSVSAAAAVYSPPTPPRYSPLSLLLLLLLTPAGNGLGCLLPTQGGPRRRLLLLLLLGPIGGQIQAHASGAHCGGVPKDAHQEVRLGEEGVLKGNDKELQGREALGERQGSVGAALDVGGHLLNVDIVQGSINLLQGRERGKRREAKGGRGENSLK